MGTVNMEKENDISEQLKVSITALFHLNFEFRKKIKELRELLQSLEKESQLHEDDCNKLKVKLKHLSLLKQKNDDLKEAFAIGFGPQAPQETTYTEEAFQLCLKDFIALDADVKQLIGQGCHKLGDQGQGQIEKSSIESEVVHQKGQGLNDIDVEQQGRETGDSSRIETSSSSDNSEPEEDERENTSESHCIRNVIISGLVIFIFYFGLFLVISHFESSRQKGNTGINITRPFNPIMKVFLHDI